jgi:hypothetical protein
VRFECPELIFNNLINQAKPIPHSIRLTPRIKKKKNKKRQISRKIQRRIFGNVVVSKMKMSMNSNQEEGKDKNCAVQNSKK